MNMDILKVNVLVILLLGFASCGQAQEDPKEEAGILELMEGMSPEAQATLLAFALERADADLLKEMKRVLRRMEAEQREEVFEFAQDVEQQAYQYHFRKARSMRPKGQLQRIGAEQKRKAAEERDDAEGPFAEMTFAEREHDFGKLLEGEQARHEFVFTNTGETPLLIEQAEGSCGCTVPKWPTEPIAVGEKGVVEVLFKSEGRSGRVRKSISISANTQKTENHLFVIAEVVQEGK
jgi:hypothetical protein